ncbi:MAG: glycosyltransferase [Corynebacterium sp.]|nr:glycosyltransferase [Corynebacterium sp.]
MRVLHVTECLAGGVQTALEGYVKATPEIEHFVLANARRGENLVSRDIEGAIACLELPENHFAAIRRIIAAVNVVKPDVIHAHSSYAGAYSRIAWLRTRIPVVYTPHALAFGRPDFSPKKRKVFKVLETLFSLNTRVFAGCSAHEALLLRNMNPKVPVVTIPNALPPDHPSQHMKWTAPQRPIVGMVGRINEYRDPEKFIEIARLVWETRPDVQFIWIGDGDNTQRKLLQESGIEVTGWLNDIALQRSITELSVLLYTSQWDGFPMVILEATASRVPTIVSDIPPLAECPVQARFGSADEAKHKVLQVLEEHQPLSGYWDELITAHSFENQKKALAQAYQLATR